jgi:hypothetical protein
VSASCRDFLVYLYLLIPGYLTGNLLQVYRGTLRIFNQFVGILQVTTWLLSEYGRLLLDMVNLCMS